MTHTLHREGNVRSLKDDYIWLVTATRGVNDDNLLEKKLKFLDIVDKVGSVNYGCETLGNLSSLSRSEFRERLKEKEGKPVIQRIRGVFVSREQVKEFLQEMKAADLGLSIVVTGLHDEIFAICREIGLVPHSIHISLGVWGNTRRLPTDKILEFTTMCGHSLISSRIVELTIEKLKQGAASDEQLAKATRDLTRICRCAIFNPVRCKRILKEKTKEQ
jgi:hypothetical protein